MKSVSTLFTPSNHSSFFPIFGGFPHIEAGAQTIFCSKRILEACFKIVLGYVKIGSFQ